MVCRKFASPCDTQIQNRVFYALRVHDFIFMRRHVCIFWLQVQEVGNIWVYSEGLGE
jgi:hypothetical protein